MNYSEDDHGLVAPAPSLQGDRLPTGTWTIDPTRSSITFTTKLVLGLKAKGTFAEYSSTIEVGESPDDSSLRVSLRADSVATGIKTRDKHLRAENVFDVAHFPVIEFVSTGVKTTADGVRITGDLRVREVAVPLTLDARASAGPHGHRFVGRTTFSLSELRFVRKGFRKPLTISFDVTLTPA